MADLLPGFSSSDEEQTPKVDASDSDEDDGAMDASFQYGGILGEDGQATRLSLGWSLGSQIQAHQKAHDHIVPRMKVSDLIAAKRKDLKKTVAVEVTEEDSEEEEEKGKVGEEDEDSDDDDGSGSDDSSSDASEDDDDEKTAANQQAESRKLEQDTLKLRAGKEDEEEESDDEDVAAAQEAKAAAAYFDSTVDQTTDASVTSFTELALSRPILKGVAAMGFVVPTPIQAAVIPIALSGRDVCASAQTGSGKTAAFLLPVMERLLHRNSSQALILTPTRELAAQCVGMMETLAQFSDLSAVLVVGGAKSTLHAQAAKLRSRPEVIIATPGRLLDHVTNSSGVSLENTEFLVLDEADRLLDLGFQDEIMELVKFVCPTVHRRQTLLFSATLQHAKVEDLVRLSLKDPVRVRVGEEDQAVGLPERLEQEFVRIRAGNEGIHREAVLLALLTRTYSKHCIVFFDTKVAAHRLMILCGLMHLKCAELHGNLTQVQRLEALEDFRKGSVDILLATDLAARGLDIDSVQSVINFEMPSTLDTYIHRIGRTARAGRRGCSCTLIGESRRSLMKQVVKQRNKNSSSTTVRSRTVPASVISHFAAKIQDLQSAIKEVLQAEAVARLDRIADMEALRAQNLIEHADEIKARPQREWFASNAQKLTTREAATEKLRKIREAAGTGKHKMTRKKRRKREAMDALNDMDGDGDGDGNEDYSDEDVEVSKPKKKAPVNQKKEARKQKRQTDRQEQSESFEGNSAEPKRRKAKPKASGGLGDGSLFSEEMVSYSTKANPKTPGASSSPASDVARSTYSFRGHDPDKRLGKIKGHKAFKSKGKYKRRK